MEQSQAQFADEDDKVALYFTRHAQQAIAEDILPAIRQAIDEMVDGMVDEISQREGDRLGLRQIATTHIINQMVNYFQQDMQAERAYIDENGQSTAIGYDGLAPSGAKAWYTAQLFPSANPHDAFWVPRWQDAFRDE